MMAGTQTPRVTRRETMEVRMAVSNPGETVLEVEHARMAYGESLVIEDISLKALSGQVVCIMGRNGVGKTTLLKGIMGTMPVRQGRISMFGKDITRWRAHERAQAGVGYVPQGRGIFPYLTVLENLQIGLEAFGGKDSGQIDEMMELFPVLEKMSGRMAGVLSGGQQQQLAIARALVGRPRLLLLDEPTEGIQPSIVEEIEGVIMSLRGRMTIVLVEQFLDFALSVADHCYVIERGEVVLEGERNALDERTLRELLAV
jgi:urea transport system ATP-binding protein